MLTVQSTLSDYHYEPNLSRAATLPARWYTDPTLFALEKENVFARTWQPVGRAEDVRRAGDFFTCEAVGEPLVVTRGEDGALRAFYNVCRHRAGNVASGKGNRKSLRSQKSPISNLWYNPAHDRRNHILPTLSRAE